MEKFHTLEALYQPGNDPEIVDQYLSKIDQITSYPIPFRDLHAAVVLGAPVAPYRQPNGEITYEFPDIMEERAGEGDILTAGEWRAVAASRISALCDHQLQFLVTGGIQPVQVENQTVYVSKAEQLSRKLQQFGVPANRVTIIGREGHGNTRGNFLDIQHYLTEHGFADRQHLQIGLITSLYQLPRTLSVPDYFSEEMSWFPQHNTIFHPIPAERLLLDREDEFSSRVRNALHTDAARKRAHLEIKGITDMKRGTYKSVLS